MKVAVIGGTPDSLVNFRGELLKSLSETCDEVFALSSSSEMAVEDVDDLGVQYGEYFLKRNGFNPFSDVMTFLSLVKFYLKVSPDKVLAYTIKPIVWGGIASRLVRKKDFYALITGLGFAFQGGGVKRNLLRNLVCFLYKMALNNSSAVIFQNPDNLELFVSLGIVAREKCHLVNGSGVDVERFSPRPIPNKKEITFLLIARLLGEKGIREYVSAASMVRLRYPEARFLLVGPEDSSPDRIDINEVEKWHSSGVISYEGPTNDVREYIGGCHVFVLPSYHEGLPRTVIEAMAMNRPILTTLAPGCKETVEDGVNGFLVNSKDPEALADKMIWFIENPTRLGEMGKHSRTLAEAKFDVRQVNQCIFNIMRITD